MAFSRGNAAAHLTPCPLLRRVALRSGGKDCHSALVGSLLNAICSTRMS